MKSQPQPIRVRIAPSPTGHLHVGTARAALFNELFARQIGGTFVVRIEDTDRARSKTEYEQGILEGFRWLNLEWQEGPDKGGPYGPYRQSERQTIHVEAIQQLLDSDQAYIDTINNNVIRLRVAPQTVTFTDLIRGEVSQHTDTWGGDFVIARSLNDPLFHLAVVVDDATQQISHIIRGEDHISNTARHILIQRALGYPTPQYAHLPLLLNEARRKLSKRAGEVSLLAYRDQGYLPQAMLNYLALLGWNPKNDQEFFSHEELATQFSLSNIQKGGAIFSIPKLQAFNKHYLRQLTAKELLDKAEPFLQAADFNIKDQTYWEAAIATEQKRVATLGELPAALDFYQPAFPLDYPTARLVWKKSTTGATQKILKKLHNFLSELPEQDFTAEVLQTKLMAWIDEQALGRGDTLWPLRVALCGRENSPGPFEIASVLGKLTTLTRLTHALTNLT